MGVVVIMASQGVGLNPPPEEPPNSRSKNVPSWIIKLLCKFEISLQGFKKKLTLHTHMRTPNETLILC